MNHHKKAKAVKGGRRRSNDKKIACFNYHFVIFSRCILVGSKSGKLFLLLKRIIHNCLKEKRINQTLFMSANLKLYQIAKVVKGINEIKWAPALCS